MTHAEALEGEEGKDALDLGIGRHGGCIKRHWLAAPVVVFLLSAALCLCALCFPSFLVKGGQAWFRVLAQRVTWHASLPCFAGILSQVAIGCVTSRRQKHSTRCGRSSQRLVRMQGVLAFLSHNYLAFFSPTSPQLHPCFLS